jgi:crossover junction endodeoxyribonuclease RusA
MTVSTSEDEMKMGPPHARSTSEIGKPKFIELFRAGYDTMQIAEMTNDEEHVVYNMMHCDRVPQPRPSGMKQVLLLPFPVPLSACFTNVKGKGRVPTRRYSDWQTEALWSIKAQNPVKFTGRIKLLVELVSPDKRERDAGNNDKAVCDILVKAGIIVDDSNKYVREVTYRWLECGDPCTVTIEALE